MKIEDQVIVLSQAKRLKELGVGQESLFYWSSLTSNPNNAQFLCRRQGVGLYYDEKGWFDAIHFIDPWPEFTYSAFTVSELSAMIGKGTNAAAMVYDAVQARMNQSHSFTICYSPKFLADCVIGLLETNRLTPAEVNERLKS